MTAPPPSLHSVAIFVNDLPRAVEFYRDTLRLPVTHEGSFGAELLEGSTHIGVHPAIHADAKQLVGRHTGITLFVPDLLHYCGDLHARGVRFVTEPTQQPWGIMAMPKWPTHWWKPATRVTKLAARSTCLAPWPAK